MIDGYRDDSATSRRLLLGPLPSPSSALVMIDAHLRCTLPLVLGTLRKTPEFTSAVLPASRVPTSRRSGVPGVQFRPHDRQLVHSDVTSFLHPAFRRHVCQACKGCSSVFPTGDSCTPSTPCLAPATGSSRRPATGSPRRPVLRLPDGHPMPQHEEFCRHLLVFG